MALHTYNWEGGSNGATVTAANSGFSQVGTGSGSSLTFDTAHVDEGSLACKVVPAASQADTLALVGMTATNVAVRLPLYLTALPTADDWLITLYNGSSRATNVHINSVGKLRLDNAAATTGVWTSTNALPLNQWVYINLYMSAGTTGSDGVQRATYDAGSSASPTEDSGTLSGQNTGTAGSVTTVQTGKVNAGTYATTFWIGTVQIDDAASDIIGPGSNQTPTANAGPDQANLEPYATVSLNGSGSSDADGSIVSYTWSQTSGTTVTLSNSHAANPTFVAPATVNGTNLTFSLTVTDNGGASSSADTVTITVLPHTIWRLDGAGPSPIQLISL